METLKRGENVKENETQKRKLSIKSFVRLLQNFRNRFNKNALGFLFTEHFFN